MRPYSSCGERISYSIPARRLRGPRKPVRTLQDKWEAENPPMLEEFFASGGEVKIFNLSGANIAIVPVGLVIVIGADGAFLRGDEDGASHPAVHQILNYAPRVNVRILKRDKGFLRPAGAFILRGESMRTSGFQGGSFRAIGGSRNGKGRKASSSFSITFHSKKKTRKGRSCFRRKIRLRAFFHIDERNIRRLNCVNLTL